MKKFVTRSILIGLVIVLLPVLSLAGSDMRRGDKGEGVREAQEWLIELGYLEDQADGIFGKKTEAAVREFQKTIGAKTTGTLSPQQLDELQFLQMDATAVMEGDGPEEDELKEMYPAGCSRTDDRPGAVDFCWRHFEAGRLTAKLRLPALPDKAILLFAEQAIPRKRALQTEEAAAVAAFLLSPRSSGIAAQKVVVDAGMSTNYFDKTIIDKVVK